MYDPEKIAGVEGPTEHERWIPWLPLGLSALGVAALLVGMLVLLPMFGRTEFQVGSYDLARPSHAVHYRGATWHVAAGRVRRPDTVMAAVGNTDEGNYVYVEGPVELKGGGGGQPAPNAPAERRDVFLRVGHNLYVQLVQP